MKNEGRVYCLFEAPNAEATQAMHEEAHGQIASEIIPVDLDEVEGWLGPVAESLGSAERFKVEASVTESAFRTTLFSDMADFTSTTQRIGDEAAMEVLQVHDSVLDDALEAHRGRKVKHTGDGMMASFMSVSDAVECAMKIQRDLATQASDLPAPINVRIGLSAGEPVERHEDLFGSAVNLASRVCDQADAGQIFVASVVRDLCIGKQYDFASEGLQELKGFDDPVQLFQVNWQD
jgi:class 3 adenylate cyclase